MRTAKLPLDLRVVITLGVISCVIRLGGIILLILGMMHVPPHAPHHVLFGTVVLSSDFSAGIHDFLMGLADLVFVYGLWHRLRWAWWYALLFTTYNVADSASLFHLYPTTAALALSFGTGQILWLLYRRQLFTTEIQPLCAANEDDRR